MLSVVCLAMSASCDGLYPARVNPIAVMITMIGIKTNVAAQIGQRVPVVSRKPFLITAVIEKVELFILFPFVCSIGQRFVTNAVFD